MSDEECRGRGHSSCLSWVVEKRQKRADDAARRDEASPRIRKALLALVEQTRAANGGRQPVGIYVHPDWMDAVSRASDGALEFGGVPVLAHAHVPRGQARVMMEPPL